MDRLIAHGRELDLVRYPPDPRNQLRAWDAADELVLRHLDEVDRCGNVVVVGDRWGALTAGLAPHEPVSVSDSWTAQEATRRNLAGNGLDGPTLLSSLDPLPERIDVLVVRIPRTLALLEHDLHRLAPRLRPGSVVVGTGMVKEIHTSTLTLFEQLVGPTRTTPAARKARLVLCTPDAALVRPADPWPRTLRMPTTVGPAVGPVAGPDVGPVAGLRLTQHAGVFSADHLDVGTRLLLEHLPQRHGPEHVLDLGCGNGVVGVVAALANPDAAVTFLDESHLAVASARATASAALGPARDLRFVVGDGGAPGVLEPGSVDLVLNNPPFHLHRSVSDTTAWRMFVASRRALRPDGELWVVGNRHLGHHTRLTRLFGGCQVVASTPKFVVLRARA